MTLKLQVGETHRTRNGGQPACMARGQAAMGVCRAHVRAAARTTLKEVRAKQNRNARRGERRSLRWRKQKEIGN
jgi:hypothetical protein